MGQGGGLILSNGVIDIVNATFADNFATFQGGAIFAGGSSEVTLTSSLFYKNRLDPTHTNPVTTEYQGYHTNRELLNGGHNLQYPRTKEPDFDNDINNLITTPAEAILFADPLLGPLADNGGPTETRALLAGSPAINAGNAAACPATDQRGVGRPQGSGCDIGAYERVPVLAISPSLVAVDEGDFTLTVYGDGFTSGSKVLWDGDELPTTFVDGMTLEAAVSGSQITGPGTVQISVSNSDLPPATLRVVESLSPLYLPVLYR